MYSLDYRKIAIHMYNVLSSLRKVAYLLNTSHSTIYRWLQCSERKQYMRSTISKSQQIIESLKTLIISEPLLSIRSIVSKLSNITGVLVSRELVRTAIKKLGFSKKLAYMYGVSIDLEAKTKAFLEQRSEYIQRNLTFLSIDETSFGRSGIVNKGYSLKGKKLYIRKKAPRITTETVIACASKESWIHYKRIQGSCNTQIFLDFLKELNILNKNTVLLMDNVAFHHSKLVKDFCQQSNIPVLFTPPYSPWFNPIEYCFSITKRCFRRTQKIDESFQSVLPHHFQAFFKKALTTVSFGP